PKAMPGGSRHVQSDQNEGDVPDRLVDACGRSPQIREMYTMIATLDDLYPNLNNVYMTLMMGAPIAIVMLVSMRSMFPSRNANLAITAVAAAVFAGSFHGMRAQAAIGDKEFLRAMIPHHSGAVLM